MGEMHVQGITLIIDADSMTTQVKNTGTPAPIIEFEYLKLDELMSYSSNF